MRRQRRGRTYQAVLALKIRQLIELYQARRPRAIPPGGGSDLWRGQTLTGRGLQRKISLNWKLGSIGPRN